MATQIIDLKRDKDENQLIQDATKDSTRVIDRPAVSLIKPISTQFVDESKGTTEGNPEAVASTVETTEQVEQPNAFDASVYNASTTGDQFEDLMKGFEAQTAQPSEKATVQGQLELLMQDFEAGTPPWASGSMRAATAVMQSRGLGASSMAGQAIVQAAMESATAIASQDAQTYATFEMTNLNNRQQSMVFETQVRSQGILSDQAAENAALQFNATSTNQVNQFLTTLQEEVKRFNATQINTMRQFNAGVETDISKFNTTIRDSRDKFNAQNTMIIAQANAQWRQSLTTANTTAQNAANMQAAKDANALTATTLDNIWQNERDLYKYVWASTESAQDRAFQLSLQKLKAEEGEDAAEAERSAQKSASTGRFLAQVAGGLLGIL